MLETLAQVLAKHYGAGLVWNVTENDRDAARAVLEALMEPSEGMMKAVVPDEAGDEEHQKAVRVCRALAADDFRAMLQAAISPPEQVE